MIRMFFFLLSGIIFPQMPVEIHDLHISRTLINFDDKTQTLQVSTYLFLNDIERALEDEGGSNLKLCTKYEDPKGDFLLKDYIKNHFVIKSGEKTLVMDYIGKEPSDDVQAVWCYFEVEGLSLPKKINIQSSILTEIFSDQKNIISTAHNNKKIDVVMLDSGNQKAEIRF